MVTTSLEIRTSIKIQFFKSLHLIFKILLLQIFCNGKKIWTILENNKIFMGFYL